MGWYAASGGKIQRTRDLTECGVGPGAEHEPYARIPMALRSAQRPEACADLFRESLRLLPRGEVPAFGEPVVMNQFGIGFFCPAARGGIDLVGKDAHGSRNRHTFRGEKW